MIRIEEQLGRLEAELPSRGLGQTPEQKIRAVLLPLVRRSLPVARSAEQPAAVSPDPETCPNCGAPCCSSRSPYCSPACRETAAFVRQFRTALANGLIFDEERQIALGQKWWNLQGGGYPFRQTLVPAKTIQKVIARAGGVCSLCGAPATEVDHVGSG